MKLYMFQTVPLSVIKSSSLFQPDPAHKLSAKLYDIYHFRVYSEELQTMDRGIVQNT
jgi:hypothetical protein